MIFFLSKRINEKYNGNFSVRDRITNEVLCAFKQGKFRTDSPVLIKKLSRHFTHSENDIMNFRELNWDDLRRVANKRGVKIHNRNKENIVRELQLQEKEKWEKLHNVELKTWQREKKVKKEVIKND